MSGCRACDRISAFYAEILTWILRIVLFPLRAVAVLLLFIAILFACVVSCLCDAVTQFEHRRR